MSKENEKKIYNLVYKESAKLYINTSYSLGLNINDFLCSTNCPTRQAGYYWFNKAINYYGRDITFPELITYLVIKEQWMIVNTKKEWK